MHASFVLALAQLYLDAPLSIGHSIVQTDCLKCYFCV